MTTGSTRDRILDEAMHLFSEQGFKATTIVQIERAAGLAAGSGGMYHYFASKETLLEAGIERHLQRLDALRDIRHVFADLGDVRIELQVTARYLLAELDREAELLRIIAAEARRRPDLVRTATDRLVGQSLQGFANWLEARSERELSAEDARALASITLTGLISTRLLAGVLDFETAVADDTIVRVWVELLAPALMT